MTVTPQQTPFRATGNTDRASFRAQLAKSVTSQPSPVSASADTIYDVLYPLGLTRLAAAMAWIERRNETDPGGLQYYGRELHNLWAVKNPPAEQATKGVWRRYPSYTAAAADWGPYILGPTYKAFTTIAEFIGFYAPWSDGNNPDAYGRAAATIINQLPLLEEEEPPVSSPLAFRVALIPAGNRNRPQTAMNAGGPRYITVHETGNTNAGANAEMHRRFTHEGGGPESVSFHYTVDDREAIQLLTNTEIGWHAGDGCDNRQTDWGCFDSVAIETCVNSDGNWEQTLRNLVLLIAKLIRETPSLAGRRAADILRQHFNASGKNCPQRIRAQGRWNWLVDEVQRELDGTSAPAFQGLPDWLPADYFKVVFPSADPNGVVTRKVIEVVNETGRLPIFLGKLDVGNNRNVWQFDGFNLMNDGGKVWREGQAA